MTSPDPRTLRGAGQPHWPNPGRTTGPASASTGVPERTYLPGAPIPAPPPQRPASDARPGRSPARASSAADRTQRTDPGPSGYGALSLDQYIRRLACNDAANFHRSGRVADDKIIETARRFAQYIKDGT